MFYDRVVYCYTRIFLILLRHQEMNERPTVANAASILFSMLLTFFNEGTRIDKHGTNVATSVARMTLKKRRVDLGTSAPAFEFFKVVLLLNWLPIKARVPCPFNYFVHSFFKSIMQNECKKSLSKCSSSRRGLEYAPPRKRVSWVWQLHLMLRLQLWRTGEYGVSIHCSWPNEYSVHQWPGRPGFNPKSSHAKDVKNGTWFRLA